MKRPYSFFQKLSLIFLYCASGLEVVRVAHSLPPSKRSPRNKTESGERFFCIEENERRRY